MINTTLIIMEDKRTFKLVNFSPIGFKMINYPVQFCSLCRGYLTEVCNTCTENNCEKCDVIQADDSYYHVHCYKFVNDNNGAHKPPPKKKYYSEEESDSG